MDAKFKYLIAVFAGIVLLAIIIEKELDIMEKENDMIEKENIPTSSNTMYCRHCGKLIEADSQFCRYCGGDLRGNAKSKLYFHWPKVSITQAQKGKIKRVLKRVCIVVVCCLIALAIGCGIDHYINSVIPKKKAKEILDEQLSILNHSKGDTLYQVCEGIISYKAIPESGRWVLDQDNLVSLTSHAWVRIEQLANDGNADAQFMLAVRYGGYNFEYNCWTSKGQYGSSNLNYEKAAYWYLRSAEQGNESAMNNLANLYYKGQGVTEDVQKALYWKRKAAYLGDDYGQFGLGDYFRDGLIDNIHGEVLKQNIDSAKYWWRKSEAQGNEIAKERLEKIY